MICYLICDFWLFENYEYVIWLICRRKMKYVDMWRMMYYLIYNVWLFEYISDMCIGRMIYGYLRLHGTWYRMIYLVMKAWNINGTLWHTCPDSANTCYLDLYGHHLLLRPIWSPLEILDHLDLYGHLLGLLKLASNTWLLVTWSRGSDLAGIVTTK